MQIITLTSLFALGALAVPAAIPCLHPAQNLQTPHGHKYITNKPSPTSKPHTVPKPEPSRSPGGVIWPPGLNYAKVVLDHHNAHRANHSAGNLTWSNAMFENARVLVKSCVWNHNTSIGGGGYGQNLAAGYANLDIGKAITGGWYEGEVGNFDGQYKKPTPDMDKFEGFGHFTQVVWKDTTSVGCMTYDCNLQGGLKGTDGTVMQGLNMFTVCNYSPVGNMLGDFDKNVFPSENKPAYTAVP